MNHKLSLLSVIVFIGLFSVSSCKPSKEKMILGKWQAINMESPKLDQQIADTKNYIDTIGKSTTPAQNLELYGVSNMDSMRLLMQQQLDMTLAEQKRMIDETWIEFMKKGIVATNFGAPQPDTINWYFDDDGALMLDEMKMKGTGSKIKMDIIKLEKDTLKLSFSENGFESTATFLKTR